MIHVLYWYEEMLMSTLHSVNVSARLQLEMDFFLQEFVLLYHFYIYSQ